MTAPGRVHCQMQNDAICASQKVITKEPPTAQSGGYGLQELWVMPLTVRGTNSGVLGAGSPTALGTLTLVAAVGGLIA
jgi:hypothetical protein